MAKSGTEYELFIKQVYECLNRADGLTDVEIHHDVKLVGAAGVEHQIDVYWTFCFGGVDYKVAIECKDYKSHVSKNQVIAFHGILKDLGNVHGIFVSKMGFQSGAVEYANKYGIQLMEIRHPIDKDWEGRVKDIHVNLAIRTIGNCNPHLFIDRKKADGITLPEGRCFPAQSDRIKIDFRRMASLKHPTEEYGQKTMYDLIKMLPVGEAGKGYRYLFEFEDAVVDIDGQKVPINRVGFTYDVYESIEHIAIYGEDSIMAVVKNITDGTERSIDKFGRVNLRNEAIIK